jgi:hypothetical protein
MPARNLSPLPRQFRLDWNQFSPKRFGQDRPGDLLHPRCGRLHAGLDLVG